MKDANTAYDVVGSSAFQQRHDRHESCVQVCRGTHFNSLACGPCVLEVNRLFLTGQHLCSLIWNNGCGSLAIPDRKLCYSTES